MKRLNDFPWLVDPISRVFPSTARMQMASGGPDSHKTAFCRSCRPKGPQDEGEGQDGLLLLSSPASFSLPRQALVRRASSIPRECLTYTPCCRVALVPRPPLVYQAGRCSQPIPPPRQEHLASTSWAVSILEGPSLTLLK